jgi:penicillin-binding protein 1A
MNPILVKMFATALALSQVTTRPDAVKTEFDPVYDQTEVVELLQAGCAHMRKAFDVEDINLDDLISTALEDKTAAADEIKQFRGISFDDLHLAYRQFCGKEQIKDSPFDIGQVIAFYNKAAADLPDHNRLKGLKLPGTTVIRDGKGEQFAELFESDHRRVWVPFAEIPKHVQKAFVAAEDKRFYEHHGVDERGLIRAFISNLADPGRPQGGSTITQQVAKNLLVGDDVSYERKIREMIVAVRLDRALSKDEILEAYLNSIFLGRGAWGIDMAAHGYFKKPASEVTIGEAAFLAGLAKGPNYFSPDRFPARARERQAYVLKRMQEDKIITDEQWKQASSSFPRIASYDRPRRDTGFYFVDHVIREARTLVGMQSLTSESYTVRSTINPKLQRATEGALQEGLYRFEVATGRSQFSGPETNLSEAIQRIDADQKTRAQRRDRVIKPLWQIALENVQLPLYDVQWTRAIVIEKGSGKRAGIRVGLPDGRILPLRGNGDRGKLTVHDVVYVAVTDDVAELRSRPKVQGAALVIENRTGRILAMAGGFSYVASQLNRATQSVRQPGSSIKPLIYLTALHKGLQPNTLVMDAPITLPPISGNPNAHWEYWTPKNYEGGASGTMTLRRALERSRNMVTARMLMGPIDQNPRESLEQICALALEAHIYPECMKKYPFVLGAQAVRMIDLAGFYSAVASEGAYVQPHAIDSIELRGQTVYKAPSDPTWLAGGDRVAFYQLRSILEGVVERGTARAALGHLSTFVGGKTGTTDEENDAWFMSFTNDVTVAVWVGYDNAGERQTLGRGGTGGHLAAPIAEPIIQASWQYQAPKVALPPPSPEALRNLKAEGVDADSGERRSKARDGLVEYLRTDAKGQVIDTRYAILGGGRRTRTAEDRPRHERSERRERPERQERTERQEPTESVNEYRPYRRGAFGSGGRDFQRVQ